MGAEHFLPLNELYIEQGNTWTDFVLWESEEDANNAMTVGQGYFSLSKSGT